MGIALNYYEHHLGDYAQATAHLTFVEDAAYSRCIRKYYADEKPLPADIAAVQRLLGARSPEEREAVETVLREFFTLTDDGWRNKRCDEELERFQSKRSKARSSANARWSRTPEHSQGNAEAMRTHSEGNALQTPDTRHHSSTANAVGKSARATRLPKDMELPDDWAKFCKDERPDLDPAETFAVFRDYWVAKAGQAGCKLDWLATWRNWVRNQRAPAKAKPALRSFNDVDYGESGLL